MKNIVLIGEIVSQRILHFSERFILKLLNYRVEIRNLF